MLTRQRVPARKRIGAAASARGYPLIMSWKFLECHIELVAVTTGIVHLAKCTSMSKHLRVLTYALIKVVHSSNVYMLVPWAASRSKGSRYDA